ncbi:cytochrome c oxidase subunit II [Glacieibacterium sp.]|uniref:cytochrome c oxidase subunit II n=1 Tax=Glacieibacterium sp. TaxID=2860237 RepID=UPI003B00C7EA
MALAPAALLAQDAAAPAAAPAATAPAVTTPAIPVAAAPTKPATTAKVDPTSGNVVDAAPVTPVQTIEIASGAPVNQRVPATAGIGQPAGGTHWDLQPPESPIAREAHGMVKAVLDPMMVIITIFVVLLLGYVVVRFRRAANPQASRTSHNTTIEVLWTLVPVLILVWIAVPSFRLLANQYEPPKADLTIKAIGHQWYWEYEYPDQGNFSFDSIMLTKEEAAKAGSPQLLDVDNRVVVPVGVTVRVLTTAADVIHAWAIPAFWVQMDAVPGRINETWFKADRTGVFFGQCNQLCGTKHAFMPIAVEVVSKERFAQWVAAKQKENGITPPVAGAPVAGAGISPNAGGSAAAEAATSATPAEPANAALAGGSNTTEAAAPAATPAAK